MNIEDETYIEQLKEIKKEEKELLNTLLSGKSNQIDVITIERLKVIKEVEKELLERLITERIYLANTIKIDPLTGCYNRRILPKIREIGTVIMCDIDYFKTINDTFGHDVGDQVIKEVGHTILNNIRVGDVACRYGGDEFLIVFTTDKFDVIDARMKKIAEEINKGINLPSFNITLSVGIAFNESGEGIESLITKADSALYASKENGRNQITYYGEPKKAQEAEKIMKVI